MPTIQIPEEIENKLNKFIERTGQSKESFAAEALLSHLEDAEDLALATERLKDIGERTSLEDLRKELGLAD